MKTKPVLLLCLFRESSPEVSALVRMKCEARDQVFFSLTASSSTLLNIEEGFKEPRFVSDVQCQRTNQDVGSVQDKKQFNGRQLFEIYEKKRFHRFCFLLRLRLSGSTSSDQKPEKED